MYVLFFVLKSCQIPNPRDVQLMDTSFVANHPSQQNKSVGHRFQYLDHRAPQFLQLASSIFLFQQGFSRQSYQLILPKRRNGNVNDVQFQNVFTNVLVYNVLIYQNFYLSTLVVPSTKVVCKFTIAQFFNTYCTSSKLDICHYSQNGGLSL